MKLLILGATSAIAHETAKCFAAEGAEFFLVGRNPDKLNAVRDDLKVRGAKCAETYLADLSDLSKHQQVIDKAIQALSTIESVLIAHGTLSDQQACEASVAEALKEFNNNAVSVISLLTILANYFEQQRKGTIAVISSVAGDRGRGKLYLYCAAKAAVNEFTAGLRNRMFKVGVHVVTIKPGWVDTPMTANLKKNKLFASAETVGKDIHKAMIKGTEVVYTPWFWRFIMAGINNIPEPMFKKAKF